ncbi:hypothetical protein DID88_003524 [Monilinia fructigena]|uniref:Zn(2)-C6 fungal-type domain-containing protein n=1 Tax=Monilinia fructigena TaxID=38457 RepID=A0A395IUR6_9HELO|nr:hypothetical protein DID88_003524 [Monilinia fructigena]
MSSSIIRPRYGGSKVRSGCVTCKARRVKCDEGRPTCQRCFKAKRTCEGYAPPPTASTSGGGLRKFIVYLASAPVDAISLLPGITTRQQRSFDFFRLRTAAELAGPFGTDLWSTVLLRTAHDEPCIFNAVVALGALHENYGYLRDAHQTYSDYALTHYQKAIQRITTLNNTDLTLHTDIVLMMCIVFSAFDSLRGQYKASLMHIASGIKILVETEKRLGGLKDGSLQKDVFLPIFVRMENQITDTGQTSAMVNTTRLIQPPILSIPRAFESVEEAQITFDSSLSYVWNMMARTKKHRTTPPPQLENYEYEGLAKWLDPLDPVHQKVDYFTCQTPSIHGKSMPKRFLSWCAAFDASQFPPSHPAVQILQTNRAMLSILFGVDTTKGEMVWDSSLPQFQSLLDYVESCPLSGCRNSPGQKDAPPTFHYHLGLLTPLYFVSTRCRDPLTRRRAIRLIESCNRKEGIWDTIVCTRISKQVMDVEEEAAIEDMAKQSFQFNLVADQNLR